MSCSGPPHLHRLVCMIEGCYFLDHNSSFTHPLSHRHGRRGGGAGFETQVFWNPLMMIECFPKQHCCVFFAKNCYKGGNKSWPIYVEARGARALCTVHCMNDLTTEESPGSNNKIQITRSLGYFWPLQLSRYDKTSGFLVLDSMYLDKTKHCWMQAFIFIT